MINDNLYVGRVESGRGRPTDNRSFMRPKNSEGRRARFPWPDNPNGCPGPM